MCYNLYGFEVNIHFDINLRELCLYRAFYVIIKLHSWKIYVSFKKALRIGSVYPNNGESYYVCSGGNYKLSYVVCEGGGFYGEREVCERLCTGEYKPSPTPQCMKRYIITVIKVKVCNRI